MKNYGWRSTTTRSLISAVAVEQDLYGYHNGGRPSSSGGHGGGFNSQGVAAGQSMQGMNLTPGSAIDNALGLGE